MGTPEHVQSIRMKLLLPLHLALIVVASGTILDNDRKHVDSYLFREFSNFKRKFGKTYSSRAEELTRLSIFEKNVYNTLPTNDQDAVLNHLANVGPLATASASALPSGNR